MDAVNSIEKEIEKVVSKFNYVDKHTANSLQELIATLDGVKKRFEEGFCTNLRHIWFCFCFDGWFHLRVDSIDTGNQVSQETSDIDLTQCLTKIRDTISRISSEHKELHACVSKVGKSIDKVLIFMFKYSVRQHL